MYPFVTTAPQGCVPLNPTRPESAPLVQTLVFSSSCTVYGVPERVPIDEECRLEAVSPYGRTKLYIEELLRDLAQSDGSWDFIILRYFNPVAAHPSGELGEHPIGVPQNLMPFVQQVATGQRPQVNVFGNDYNTRDGTCIRDYIHIMDLADAHVAGTLILQQFLAFVWLF